MMKKFLPGASDGEKPKGTKDEGVGRDIASQGVSVLGRNQNIFEEISKAYKRKSIEGVIVFKEKTN